MVRYLKYMFLITYSLIAVLVIMTTAFDLIEPPIIKEEKQEESIYFFIDNIILATGVIY
jgi:predicted ABC-type sugar transport system permease subunit